MTRGRRAPSTRILDPQRGLWQMIPAPVVAGLYFLVCYIATSVHCARAPDAPLQPLWLELAIATVLTLGVITWCGIVAWRRWRIARTGGPEHRDVAFIARMACLLAVLSWVGTLFVGAPLLVIRQCV